MVPASCEKEFRVREVKQVAHRKSIVIIAPSTESINLYQEKILQFADIKILTYSSVEAFNKSMSKTQNYYGFIIDLRVLIKASEGDKEFFYYLIETFPVVRITHTPDLKTIKGNIKGKNLQDDALFRFFLEDLPQKIESDDSPKYILIAENTEDQDRYRQFFQKHNLETHLFGSVGSFKQYLDDDPFFLGFFIDMRIFLKAKLGEKDFLTELRDSFPSILLSISKTDDSIVGNIRSQSLKNEEMIQYFLEHIARNFKPRGIRRQSRKKIFFNVLLNDPTKNESEARIRVNTENLSETGCFIILDMNRSKLARKTELQMVFTDISDKTPIKGIVRWIQEWGSSYKKLPGIGVEFSEIKGKQILELLNA